MNRFLAGAAKVTISPPPCIRLAGYGARSEPAQGVHDDLWAQVLVLGDGERQVAVATVDVLALSAELVSEVRCSLEQEPGIPATHVLFCASHTHSGPDLTADTDRSTAYRAELSEKLRRAMRAALHNRREARVLSRTGLLPEIARNRRPGGGPMDPEVGVLGVETTQGELIAILVNYTCHATVLGADNLLTSADYPGYMRAAIEGRLGQDVVILFANGALGNINPGGYSPELSMIGHPIPHRTFADAGHLGTRLAAVVLQVLEQPGPAVAPLVDSRSTWVELPFKDRLSRHQVEADLTQRQRAVAELTQKQARPDECLTAQIELAYARLRLSLLEALEREGPAALAEVQAVRIGDAYLVGIPGEPFVEIGLEIKRRSGLPHVFVVGLANGYVGYIPTEEAYAVGGYEPAAARVAPGADAAIVNTALSLLESLQQEKTEGKR
ncbi:MAG: hypothetical protein M5U01_34405 [Ardenticatenaceae bacterium]|nr:hypothetical protein [Ardenticatenaceae bacterium]